jgi:hypothetical protein
MVAARVPSPRSRGQPRSRSLGRTSSIWKASTGFAVLPGIMTEPTRQRWKAACVDVQRINDRLLLETDWGSVDWAACGLEQPIERVSTADLEAASLGGCQLPVPAGVRPAGFSHYLHRDVPGMAFGWGGFPESHAVEHS